MKYESFPPGDKTLGGLFFYYGCIHEKPGILDRLKNNLKADNKIKCRYYYYKQ